MPKTLIRLVALVLIPCMLVDPVTASTLPGVFSPVKPIGLHSTRLTEEALSERAIPFTRQTWRTWGHNRFLFTLWTSALRRRFSLLHSNRSGFEPQANPDLTMKRLTFMTLATSGFLSFSVHALMHEALSGIWDSALLYLFVATISFLLSLFPVNYFFSLVLLLTTQTPLLTGRKFINAPHFANIPLAHPVVQANAPTLTIHMPIYLESFEGIKPSLDAARIAMENYNIQFPGRANFVISDDGLLVLAQNNLEEFVARARSKPEETLSAKEREVLQRLAYYEAHQLTVIARPAPDGRPATARAGFFKKASNLNYTLRLIDNTLNEEAARLGWHRGPLWMGNLILMLDKDSMTPPDILELTAREFVADPTLAYTQHQTIPTNETETFYADMMGYFTRMLYSISLPAKVLSTGKVPFVGHNGFIRRAVLQDQGYWDEQAASEDLVFAMRAEIAGFHGKYILWANHPFGEAVSRVFIEEGLKYFRYAFGAGQVLFNPISTWFRKGIWSPYIRSYGSSPFIRWYSLVDLLIYKMCLVNLASVTFFGFLALSMPWIDTGGTGRLAGTLVLFNVLPNLVNSIAFKDLEDPDHRFNTVWERFWYREKKLLLMGASFTALAPYALIGWISRLFNVRVSFPATDVDQLHGKPLNAVLRSMKPIHLVSLSLGSLAFVLGSILQNGATHRMTLVTFTLGVQIFIPYVLHQPFWTSLKTFLKRHGQILRDRVMQVFPLVFFGAILIILRWKGYGVTLDANDGVYGAAFIFAPWISRKYLSTHRLHAKSLSAA